MDDRHAALSLGVLTLAGAVVRFALAPAPSAAAGDIHFAPVDTPPSSSMQATARTAARLLRPLQPGERIDLDRADVTEITRLPRVGPALAERMVAWRAAHGPFGSLTRLDSVPGVGPQLLEALRQYVTFSGAVPPAR
ncbi:MAG TPA: helix-hairpin-helix domain-containing protein [Gemmatimonadales bacterium]|jgi:competence protein ComEA|nr:helix-hairpin-helix domain-containing protein [Gemmatimonadales bacterium]